jgi:hypothetical protein
VLGGGGNDTFVWDPGDGSDTIEGQGGTDAMDFHGSNANENIDLSANGTRVRLFRDVANITMDLNGIEALNLDTLGGTDTVNVHNLTGTGLTAANVNLAGFDGNPDGSADNVNVIGTDGADNATVGGTAGVVKVTGLGETVNVSGAEAADGVGVNTIGGDDTITNSVLTPGPAAINVDGGADSDTTTYNGTAAADTIGIANNGTAVATFTPDESVRIAATKESNFHETHPHGPHDVAVDASDYLGAADPRWNELRELSGPDGGGCTRWALSLSRGVYQRF